MKKFAILALRNGRLLSINDGSCIVRGWKDSTLTLESDRTHFIFVKTGMTTIDSEIFGCYFIKPGMWASIPEQCQVSGEEGLAISIKDYQGIFQIGGILEQFGRLKYIDGCSDSVLIPPVKKGNPCLNALYFPEMCSQTRHTHPSFRVGMILSGQGLCHLDGSIVPLYPGSVFYIPEDEPHCFHTQEKTMNLIAFHPDSDFGATDEEHPMIVSTIIDGVPASQLL